MASKDLDNVEDKSSFMKHFEQLRPDFFLKEMYESPELREEANTQLQMSKTRAVMFSSIPMKCRAAKCNPPGTMIRTQLGEVPIEDLDPARHLIASWDRNAQAIRGGFVGGNIKGYRFSMSSRKYSGLMTTIQTNDFEYKATKEHVCITRWNARSKNAYGVYMMQRGNFWRIGKAKLFYAGKSFGPALRARTEKADRMWLLGVYDSNVEAMLAEEFYSVKFQVSKSLFINDKLSCKNLDGMYKWITQEQLDNHHKSLSMSQDHYERCLASLGLDIDLPIWEANRKDDLISNNLGQSRILQINASNIVSGYMDVPVIPPTQVRKNFKAWVTDWSNCSVSRSWYEGKVYSLTVEKHHTYFANSIATHNCEFADTCPLQQKNMAPLGHKCPYEMSMVSDFMQNLMEDLTVDPENMVEVSMVRDLVDQEIQHIRKSNFLAREDLIQENVIGLDSENRPIIKKELHLAVELEDKILKRKREIRNQLLATREAKAKAGQGMVDSAQVISTMFEQIREIDLTRDRLLREKLGTLGQDSYIESQQNREVIDAEVIPNEE